VSTGIKKHILVVCGVPQVLAEMKKDLLDSFDVSMANSGEAARTALDVYEVSAVVIYIGESRQQAFSVFSAIYEPAKSGNIPIVFLAEKGNDNDENTAFAMGAADYSTRRQGTTKSLINRINLRINASEHEKQLMSGLETPSAAPAEPHAILIGKTILLAEDIEINRDIVAAMLGDIEGFVMDTARDGQEAVDMFKKNPCRYALILMDIQMPVMDGIEATKAIRGLGCDNARDIPIIALTADTAEKDVEHCLDAGMNDFIGKPVSLDELFAVAAEHCI